MFIVQREFFLYFNKSVKKFEKQGLSNGQFDFVDNL